MNIIISITLLLLITGAVKSWEPLEESFTQSVGKRSDHQTKEQIGAFPGSCRACKYIVSKVRQKLGSDHSKAKIRQMLNNVCNGIKCRPLKSACRTLVRKYRDKLIDALVHRGSSRSICVKLRMCKRHRH